MPETISDRKRSSGLNQHLSSRFFLLRIPLPWSASRRAEVTHFRLTVNSVEATVKGVVYARLHIYSERMVSGVASQTPSSRRLESLDLLRGLTVALMIIVNTSGDSAHTFHQLAHSKWNGCTLADVIFPCFLFMMGMSATLSVTGKLKRAERKGAILLQALRRCAILFLLGLAVNTFPLFHLHTLRIFGVLQRIAFCYLAVTILLVSVRPRVLYFLIAVIAIGYWVALRWVPIPQLGRPLVDVPFLDRFANLASWLDRMLVPQPHLYRQGIYDPEGLLSSVSSLVNTIAGAVATMWVRRAQPLAQTAKGLMISGAAALILGLAWSPWFPLNKRLWTSSFALFNVGLSLIALWFFFRVVDMRPHLRNRWKRPLHLFGTNALLAYIFSEFLASFLGAIHLQGGLSLEKWLYRPLPFLLRNEAVAAATYAVLFMLLCYAATWGLSKRNIVLKV